MKAVPYAIVVLFLSLVAGGCGGKDEVEKKAQSPAEIAAALDQGPRASQGFTLDEVLAEQGATLFEDKICSDCHTFGESDLAPDLTGVLDRRTRPWLIKQISEPEWMNEHDPITQALIEEFDLEMVGTGATPDDAEAILHYLMRESEGAP